MRISDWSSDVCSSDLAAPLAHQAAHRPVEPGAPSADRTPCPRPAVARPDPAQPALRHEPAATPAPADAPGDARAPEATPAAGGRDPQPDARPRPEDRKSTRLNSRH